MRNHKENQKTREYVVAFLFIAVLVSMFCLGFFFRLVHIGMAAMLVLLVGGLPFWLIGGSGEEGN